MTLLSLNKICVNYPKTDQIVLDDVSLTLSDNEITVVLGTSGCGKTTLLNVIAGFIPTQSGEITLDENSITKPNSDRGVVFQDDILLPWLNVKENVAFGLKLAGIDKQARKATANEILKQVSLSEFGNRSVWELSGGQQQRVGIARALASDPKILLMDEPFGALDAFTREQMQELLLAVSKQTQKPIFLITHDIEEAIFLATNLIIMTPNPGRIVDRLTLNFSERYKNGESARKIKSDPDFIAMREQILAKVFIHQ